MQMNDLYQFDCDSDIEEEDEDEWEETQDLLSGPPITTAPPQQQDQQQEQPSSLTLLAHPLHVFIWNQIEVFTATATELAEPGTGRKQIQLNQVGL